MAKSVSMQGFLNAATSADSGYYKFSCIKRDDVPGRVTVFYRIADCSTNIELDFGVYGVSVDSYSKAETRNRKIKQVMKEITGRRKKMKTFAAKVSTFAEKYDAVMQEAYDDLEAELNKEIEE